MIPIPNCARSSAPPTRVAVGAHFIIISHASQTFQDNLTVLFAHVDIRLRAETRATKGNTVRWLLCIACGTHLYFVAHLKRTRSCGVLGIRACVEWQSARRCAVSFATASVRRLRMPGETPRAANCDIRGQYTMWNADDAQFIF